MATLKAFVLVAACGCSDLQGFGGASPPLVSFDVTASGDLGTVRAPDDTGTPSLHFALVWGRQWLVEPICILPPENADAAAVIAAGCRDPFGFVPALVAADTPAELGVPATLDLFSLPGSDIMVGDLTARVAYATVVLYDDKDGDGALSLGRPNRPPDMTRPMDNGPVNVTDLVYGTSFLTMTQPDQRIAYREGAFVQSGFYPRAGCADPVSGFSVVGAGGFTADAAIAATLAGTLPTEDPASCTAGSPMTASLDFGLQTAAALNELRCTERTTDSSVRYREPGENPPDLTNRTTACVHSPSFGAPSDVIEFVVSGRSDDSCVGLTHYILKGCTESPTCGSPDWDDGAPLWWPC